MLKKLILSTLLLVLVHVISFSQYTVTGQVSDKSGASTLPGATVSVINQSDTSKVVYGSTNEEGRFRIEVPVTGNYRVDVSYVGYDKSSVTIEVSGERNQAGNILLSESKNELNEVKIEDKLPLATQDGDTTNFNPDAYKVNKDATVQDLITKLPGVTVENGTIKAQGEEIKKVLVDGKPFFGDDPNLALKNLPADIIDKIQIYDKMSDQSEFTGFNDGNTSKTINIITKKESRNGQFGKIYGGLGLDYRYAAGLNLNLFDNDRKISILGMSNNINQQNFSSEDLVGVASSSPQRGGPGGGGFRGPGGGSSTNNFLTGQQNGVATTHAFGINYVDVWGKKKNIKFSGSYFFNYAVNNKDQDLNRQYFLSADSSQYYSEKTLSESQNYNHRVNLRFEFEADSFNSVIFTPTFSFQRNISNQNVDALTRSDNQSLLNTTLNTSSSDRSGYNAGGDLMFRHKFKKQFRTLMWNVGGNFTSNENNSSLHSDNIFYADTTGVNDSLNQQGYQLTMGYKVNTRLSYTEPVGKSGMMLFDYSIEYNNNRSEKETNAYNYLDSTYTLLDTLLSSNYLTTSLTNEARVGYRLRGKKFNFMINAAYQNILFDAQQLFPTADTVSRVYHNVLPMAMFQYRFSKSENLRIFYRTSTSLPSVSQLQTVVDNSNPLLLSTGNASLVRSYSHTASVRYNTTNTEKATVMFFTLGYTYTHDYIANSTFIAEQDTTLSDGIFLGKGAQLSRPVNLQGYMNANGAFTYGFPIKKIKTNLNLSTSVGYSRTPGLINNDINYANSLSLSQGFTFSSNISEKIDFTISYTGSYNIVINTLRSQGDNNYFNQTAQVKFNWQFWKGFVFNTNLNHSFYTGLSSGYNQNVFIWSASLGYKFLKDESLELKAQVFDILGQNQSVTRNVTETYVEDQTSNVVQRYFMVTLTYNLKNFAR